MYRGQIKYVIKRDGSSELFDVNKIRAALEKAFAEVDG